MNARSKHPSERGIREKNGRWEYRFKVRGKIHSRVTDLKAVPENVLAAQSQKVAHLEALRKGKRFIRQVSLDLDQAIQKFIAWYRSEHRNRKCGWAASLLASFQFYFEQRSCLLSRIGSGELENFKMWRRENGIHDNTLRKQLLLLDQFFKYSRKQGWTDNDPFARGDDDEVKIPTEQDSGLMRVLSPKEEGRYLSSAKQFSMDLADVVTIIVNQGPRPDEVMSLRQDQVDLNNRRFTIWDTNAQGKSRNAHRTLKMTDQVFSIFQRRLASSGVWVFPSPKMNGPRTTLQKAHQLTVRGRRDREGTYRGGSGVECRLYDFRHTFATRFALAGGSLPVLAKILGHADLSLLMRYVHPSQVDMDRAMEWYNLASTPAHDLEQILVEEGGKQQGWPRPPLRPPDAPNVAEKGQNRANLEDVKRRVR
ncbi:MAG: tyrosine-type recombinase/integrase [Bryobacteraceae bacterium]